MYEILIFISIHFTLFCFRFQDFQSPTEIQFCVSMNNICITNSSHYLKNRKFRLPQQWQSNYLFLYCSTLFSFLIFFIIGYLIARYTEFVETRAFRCKSYLFLEPETSQHKSFSFENFPHNSDENLVFVGILTAQEFMKTRVVAVNESWVKGIPGKVIIFGKETAYTDDDIPLVRLPGTDDTYPPQKKSFMMLKYMYDHFLDHFEFFMRTDDDVYIRPDKLQLLLRSLNSSDPMLVGQPGKGVIEEIGHLSLLEDENFCMGGPGVIFSRATLTTIGPQIDKCLENIHSFHEDVEISRCVQKFAGLRCTWSTEVSFQKVSLDT